MSNTNTNDSVNNVVDSAEEVTESLFSSKSITWLLAFLIVFLIFSAGIYFFFGGLATLFEIILTAGWLMKDAS